MGNYLMALDAGIGGGRCLVFDTSGACIVSKYREWIYDRPPGLPDAVEFDAVRFWGIMCSVIGEALAATPGGAGAIAAVSATSVREGFVLFDARDREIYAAPSFDERGRAYNAMLAGEMGERFYQITGHWPASLHQPGRFLWLREQDPERWAKARSMVMIADWLLFRLSGEKAGEPSMLSTSVLFDMHKLDWSDELIERVHVPRSMLPPVRKAGERLGEVSRRAASETGLRAGTPVVIGGADSQIGLVGTGATRPGRVTAVAGTTTPILMVVDRPVLDPQIRPWTRCHAVPGTWALEANGGMTGISFRWVRDALCEADRAEAARLGIDPYDLMDRRAERVPIGCNGVVSMASGRMDSKRIDRMFSPTGFMGLDMMQPTRTNLDHMIRAMMENICYSIRSNVHVFEEVLNEKVSELRFCGGQARSPFWV